MIELSKKEKKIIRGLIEIGLQKELAKGLYDAHAILNDWKNKGTDNRTAYHALYKSIEKFDRHIARRYDGMTGSKYIFFVAAQLADGIITQDDLKELSEQTQNAILFLSGKG